MSRTLTLGTAVLATLLLHHPQASAARLDAEADGICPARATSLVAVVAQAQSGQARQLTGHVLVGVDALGRIAIAIDAKDKGREVDGHADYYILFTAADRLSGPWARTLTDATLVDSDGNVSLRSRSDDFALSLTLGGWRHRKAPAGFGEVLEITDGLGITRTEPDPGGAGEPLASLSHSDVESWPATFWYDTLDYETNCNFSNCSSGGPWSPQCSIAGCPGAPVNCTVQCSPPRTHACCGCDPNFGVPPPASCVCIFCPMSGDPP
jgi:hypothetical protein